MRMPAWTCTCAEHLSMIWRLHHRLKSDPACFQRDDEELLYEVGRCTEICCQHTVVDTISLTNCDGVIPCYSFFILWFMSFLSPTMKIYLHIIFKVLLLSHCFFSINPLKATANLRAALLKACDKVQRLAFRPQKNKDVLGFFAMGCGYVKKRRDLSMRCRCRYFALFCCRLVSGCVYQSSTMALYIAQVTGLRSRSWRVDLSEVQTAQMFSLQGWNSCPWGRSYVTCPRRELQVKLAIWWFVGSLQCCAKASYAWRLRSCFNLSDQTWFWIISYHFSILFLELAHAQDVLAILQFKWILRGSTTRLNAIRSTAFWVT